MKKERNLPRESPVPSASSRSGSGPHSPRRRPFGRTRRAPPAAPATPESSDAGGAGTPEARAPLESVLRLPPQGRCRSWRTPAAGRAAAPYCVRSQARETLQSRRPAHYAYYVRCRSHPARREEKAKWSAASSSHAVVAGSRTRGSAQAGGRARSEDAGRFEAAAAEGTGRPCDGPKDGDNDADSCVSDAGSAAVLLPTVVDDIKDSDSEYDDGDSGGEAATSCRQSRAGSESAAGSDVEAQRWHRRKELNRIAAQKCRRRRKEKAQNAQVEVRRLLTMNSELKWKLSELLTAKSRLCDLVKSHFGDATVDELIRTVSQ